MFAMISRNTIHFVLLLWLTACYSFHPTLTNRKPVYRAQSWLSMKWVFSKGPGSLQDAGLIGSEGEFYFHPNKAAKLKGPPELLSAKSRVIPIFPYNNVLFPLGTEMLNIVEMKHRQLLGDIGLDGVFGFCYYSQQQQKLGLVGTLARIKDRKIMEDGRTIVVIEGIDRFYLEGFTAEKPYMKARVQIFRDISENKVVLDSYESEIFNKVRVNSKVPVN